MNTEEKLLKLEARLQELETSFKQLLSLTEVLVKAYQSNSEMQRQHLEFMQQLSQSLAPLVI